MDTSYAQLDLPFRQAMSVIATVISVSRVDGYAVADAGLKAFGMDHGEPAVVGHTMFFTSDEHATFVPSGPAAEDAGSGDVVQMVPGDRVEMIPAHIDPTMALHERIHVIESRSEHGSIPMDTPIIDTWPIDMRNW